MASVVKKGDIVYVDDTTCKYHGQLAQVWDNFIDGHIMVYLRGLGSNKNITELTTEDRLALIDELKVIRSV